MSIQLPLSLDGLYDGEARLAGCPKPPATRKGCAGGCASRMRGDAECPHVLCRYHLIGELARRPEHEADAAMLSRVRGEWVGSCALDYAETHDRGVPDALLAKILGIGTDRLVQVSAEATARVRRRLEESEAAESCSRCGSTDDVD